MRTDSFQQTKVKRRKLLLRIRDIENALQQEKMRADTVMRLQAEELRKTRDYYLTLLENFPALIWRADTTAACNYFNTTWLTFTGRTMKQELGNGWTEGVHPDDFQQCLDIYRAAFERRRPFVMEYRLRRHDGEYRTLSDHGAPMFSPDGTFTGYLGSCYDVHDQKMLAERLRHSQKMESIGILAGGVAHDFNNILSVILGYGGMLLLQTPPETQAHEQLTSIIDAALRASDLTRRLLTFSRKQESVMEQACLCELVGGFETFLRRLTGDKVTLRMEMHDCPLMVNLSRGAIEQVLMNLTVNARDAMPDGGLLTITARKTRIEDEQAAALEITPGPYVCLTVRDTGTGISAEILPKVFDPFFTTKEVGKGSGLGLSMIYGIVKQHKGCVGITSQAQHGATVTIHLPLVKRQASRTSTDVNTNDNSTFCATMSGTTSTKRNTHDYETFDSVRMPPSAPH